MDRNSQKDFLHTVSKMMSEINRNAKYSDETRDCMMEQYAHMSEADQESSLALICGAVSGSYNVAIYFMAELLRILKDLKIINHLAGILMESSYPLWERLNDMTQLRFYLFAYSGFEGHQTYRSLNMIYKEHLDEITAKTGIACAYIPYRERGKKIIIILSQLLGTIHAPTNWLKVITGCCKELSYDVECFVCHLAGKDGHWDYQEFGCFQNFMDSTGQFEYMLDGEQINGYNLALNSSEYIAQLEKAARVIWERKPEYVLEIGEATILAGLCRPFTTVVTMGCTKNMPVTNAPLIALQKDYRKEELQMWKEQLDDGQKTIEAKMLFRDMEHRESYKKEDFGISEEDFVIVIAGNRLDAEIKQDFLEIIYQILELEVCFKIAVIGVCPDFEKRVLAGDWAGRFFFLGGQRKFREAIAIGDVFLNPQRIGGGSGGMFAILEEVPVITLGHCDVESIVGEDFVCGGIEEMPSLVHRYYADLEFMKKQKKNCRKAAMRHAGIDNKQSLRKLSEAVREYAKGMERQ